MKNLQIQFPTAEELKLVNDQSSWSLKGYIQKSEMTENEVAAFDAAILSYDGYCHIDGDFCQVFSSQDNRYRVVSIDKKDIIAILNRMADRVKEYFALYSDCSWVEAIIHTTREHVSHLLANCLDVTNGHFEECEKLFHKVELAYEVSGFGECLLISFLQGDYMYDEMIFLLDLACNADIAQLRKERKESKLGSPFFPVRKTRDTKNIFGRYIRRPMNHRRLRK